jgi:hypothetical protein
MAGIGGMTSGMRLVALECPKCGARFTRDKYVTHWKGDSEAALEVQLRATLARLNLRCIPCDRSVGDFVTIWAPAA